jgi:hypothetical protein
VIAGTAKRQSPIGKPMGLFDFLDIETENIRS